MTSKPIRLPCSIIIAIKRDLKVGSSVKITALQNLRRRTNQPPHLNHVHTVLHKREQRTA